MNLQLIVVIICVLIAAVFMGKRFYVAWHRKACACEKDCKSRACSGGGICPGQKSLRELNTKGKIS